MKRTKQGLCGFWKTPLQLVTQHLKSVWLITYLPRYQLSALSNPSVPHSAANAKVLDCSPLCQWRHWQLTVKQQSENPSTASEETATPTCVNPLKATTLSPQHSYRLINQKTPQKNYRQDTMIECLLRIQITILLCNTSHVLSNEWLSIDEKPLTLMSRYIQEYPHIIEALTLLHCGFLK